MDCMMQCVFATYINFCQYLQKSKDKKTSITCARWQFYVKGKKCEGYLNSNTRTVTAFFSSLKFRLVCFFYFNGQFYLGKLSPKPITCLLIPKTWSILFYFDCMFSNVMTLKLEGEMPFLLPSFFFFLLCMQLSWVPEEGLKIV